MGVKTLWVVLEPVKDPTPLEDLKGQTIAVDLSSWICESIAAVNAFKPHLRNLFYRVVNLSRLNIQPVFVIDGDPPELKSNELVKRAHIQGDSKNKHGEKKPGMQRTRLKTLQYECCKLLDVLGVPYIQATGEAEAMCALLNKEGLVDGVFTEDGDAFLYGAKKVYKNLTAGSNGSHVDVYDMLDIEEKLTLNRNKLIAMALLMGCDYLSDGVPSVGKTNATQLMHSLGDIDVLERFHEWTQEKSQDDDPNQIVTSDEDDDGRSIKRKRRKKKRKLTLEEKIKCKALKIDGFPNQKVIDEFLIPKDVVPSTPFQHATPDFAEIMTAKQLYCGNKK
ncbi:flap endonuclease GEN homolog 1-like [Saccoglossus kowalevskii]|uniref:Flap endonuclease GEN homolog 1-like n=1 Tax=Saccoglossus kowalevskii TaxID=10224 RepID=A0ABM0H079_SACKO|nr:PREDICTED: flap endonuclease GEN homolog 1-like [Saccoglossus kowalevskii]